jgi:hypothetical protein
VAPNTDALGGRRCCSVSWAWGSRCLTQRWCKQPGHTNMHGMRTDIPLAATKASAGRVHDTDGSCWGGPAALSFGGAVQVYRFNICYAAIWAGGWLFACKQRRLPRTSITQQPRRHVQGSTPSHHTTSSWCHQGCVCKAKWAACTGRLSGAQTALVGRLITRGAAARRSPNPHASRHVPCTPLGIIDPHPLHHCSVQCGHSYLKGRRAPHGAHGHGLG